jgi:hypothetical protein
MPNNFLSGKRRNLQIALVVGATAALAGLAAAPLAATAARQPDLGIVEFVTPQGTTAVHLGTTARALRKGGLIGPLHKGCELDPGQRVAKLRPGPGTPAKGTAVFGGPRGKKLTSLTIVGGATTRKYVGIGATPEAVLKAYPHAVYNAPGSTPPFAEGFIWVNSPEHPVMTFTVGDKSELVTAISVPSPNFCE